jgi:hypothetical protein
MAGSARLDQIRASIAGKQLAPPPETPAAPLAKETKADGDAAADKTS